MRLLISWVRDFVDVRASPEEIADRLGIAVFTVKVHVRRIFAKLCARNRAHAVAIGIRQKLLQLPDAA